MFIQVNKHYVGLDSRNNMIYPGIYEVGDPLLYGLEHDLVEIGYAHLLESEEAVEPPEAKPVLDKLTRAELDEEAAKLGLDTSEAKTKADVIALIEAAAGSGEAAQTEDKPAEDGKPAEAEGGAE